MYFYCLRQGAAVLYCIAARRGGSAVQMKEFGIKRRSS